MNMTVKSSNIPIISLCFAIVVQTFGIAYFMGGLTERVDHIEAGMQRIDSNVETLLAYESRIVRLETRLDDLIKSQVLNRTPNL